LNSYPENENTTMDGRGTDRLIANFRSIYKFVPWQSDTEI